MCPHSEREIFDRPDEINLFRKESVLFWKLTQISFLQPRNASSPMFLTHIGILILFRFMQPSKACDPIVSTELSGIKIDSRLMHPINALSAMYVTLSDRAKKLDGEAGG